MVSESVLVSSPCALRKVAEDVNFPHVSLAGAHLESQAAGRELLLSFTCSDGCYIMNALRCVLSFFSLILHPSFVLNFAPCSRVVAGMSVRNHCLLD